jgi:hypothetical protein
MKQSIPSKREKMRVRFGLRTRTDSGLLTDDFFKLLFGFSIIIIVGFGVLFFLGVYSGFEPTEASPASTEIVQ